MTYILQFKNDDGSFNFRMLLEAFSVSNYVFNIVFRRGGVLTLEDAEDITNDILLLIFLNISQFSGETLGEFLAWVRMIAIHEVTRAIAAAKKNPTAMAKEFAIDNLEASLLSDPAKFALARSTINHAKAGLMIAHDRLKSKIPTACLDMEAAGLPMGPRMSLTVVAEERGKSRAALVMAWARYQKEMEAELVKLGYDADQRWIAFLIMEYGAPSFVYGFDAV